MRSKIYTFFIFVLLGLPVCAFCADKPGTIGPDVNYGINFWREAEGLPQSRIRAIIQTHDGYIWLGTDNGAVRFNGTSFTAFTVETGSLRDNEVWSLVEDDSNGLWIGTYGGGLTLLRDGKFTTFTTADGLPNDVILQIDKDASGNIWIATPSGVGRYSRGIFTTFKPNAGLSSDYVHSLNASSPQGIFVATGQKLFHFQDGQFIRVDGVIRDDEGIVEHLQVGRDGSLLLSLGGGVIKRWKDGVIDTYDRENNLTPHITAIYEDAEGVIWAGLENGLNRLSGGKFEPVELETDAARLGVIYCLFGDHEGNIWLGLQANGLGRLRINELSTISVTDGLLNESTRSIFQDRQGTYWIGTATGFATYRDGKIVNYTDLEGGRLGPVRSFAEDDEGGVWIAAGESILRMHGGELSRFPGWTGKFEIEALYKDLTGKMWIGTDGDGLFCFESGKFTNYTTHDGLAENSVRGILRDSSGNLWISCFGRGISKFVNGTFTNYSAQDGLAGNRVLSLYEDDERTLWFATREGLSRFREGKFFNYTVEAGLYVGFVYSILDDEHGNFWFSCAQGLFRVRKSELKDVAEGRLSKVNSIDYGVRDGMKTRAFNLGNQPAAWKGNDGRLMFCSLKGVVIVDPARISSSDFVPPVYVEEVAINREKTSPADDLSVPVGAGEAEIHFAALSYNDPEKLRFKYKLEGYDADWVDAGTRRFAYYANLSPGPYKFRVVAGNVDGAWNHEGATYGFYFKPRFYQTNIFVALMALCVMAIAALVYWISMHELKVRYSAVLSERKRIAIEIHDTLAQNLAGIALQLDSVTMRLVGIPDGLRKDLDQICNLTRYSLSEARRAVSDLRSTELENQGLDGAIPQIVAKLQANSKFQIDVRITGTPRKLPPVAEKNLLRIFQESLANAIKHSGAASIKIRLDYGDASLVLRVADDGGGFDRSNVNPLGVGHYGLIGMQERAEKIGGHFDLYSGPESGTTVAVELPYSAIAESRSILH